VHAHVRLSGSRYYCDDGDGDHDDNGDGDGNGGGDDTDLPSSTYESRVAQSCGVFASFEELDKAMEQME
jgi:hypothetical protein